MASHASSSDTPFEESKHSKEFPPPGADEENVPVNEDGNNARPSEVPDEKTTATDDKADPKNWSVRFKWWCTVQLAFCALAGSMGSSIISPGEASIAAYTGVTAEAAVLCVSLYM